MPIFELDTGRPTVLQPMQPAAGTFDTDSRALVTRHLVSLLGEPLFPVAAGLPGSDRPHQLAIDAAGQPVVVEVVQVLDGAGLTRALRLAGAAARMSSVDLARAYPSGPEEFATDLVAFRETVPVARAHAAARHGGARLFVVCSEVAEEVVDAVDFLRGARRLEVLQLGVLRGADGRRYAEVSPLAPHLPARRPVEPSSLRAVPPTGALTVLAGATVPGPRGAPSGESGRERVVGALAPGATFPSVLPVPVGPVPAAADTAAAAADGPVTEESTQATEGHPQPEHRHQAPDAPRAPSTSVTTARDPSADADSDPLPDLVALAARVGGPATLVWNRLRRGQRLVAVLRADGLLELPDGVVVADPDVAATVLADAESPLDGWRAWRIGDDGPSLHEAVGR